MIKIFSPTDMVFSSNGDVVMQAVKAKIHKKDNGDYYLDLETSLDYVDYIVKGNIVVAPTPQGDQAFRIDNPIKTKSKVTAKAWQESLGFRRMIPINRNTTGTNTNFKTIGASRRYALMSYTTV